jgi:CBS domain-containing protein
MSRIAAEIMDQGFPYASLNDSILGLLQEMDHRGLGCAPVLDLAGHPLGMATVREIESCQNVKELTDHLKRSAVSVSQSVSIEEAARTLAQKGAESLVLLDEHGVAVGALSALDLLRAMLGFDTECREPGKEAAKRGARSKGLHLDLDAVQHTPAAPGVILLSRSDDAEGRRPVWVEATDNLRERLDEMLRLPQEAPRLEALLADYPRLLHFRALIIRDPERRARFARSLGRILAHEQASVVAG